MLVGCCVRGCSSCPPADAFLESLSRDQPVPRAQIIPVGFTWTTSTTRLEGHLRLPPSQHVNGVIRRSGDNLYTPQIVVDGHDVIEDGKG